MGLSAYNGIKNIDLTGLHNTLAEQAKCLTEEAPVVTHNLSLEAKDALRGAWASLCVFHRSLILRIRQVVGVRSCVKEHFVGQETKNFLKNQWIFVSVWITEARKRPREKLAS